MLLHKCRGWQQSTSQHISINFYVYLCINNELQKQKFIIVSIFFSRNWFMHLNRNYRISIFIQISHCGFPSQLHNIQDNLAAHANPWSNFITIQTFATHNLSVQSLNSWIWYLFYITATFHVTPSCYNNKNSSHGK